ncbi:MAG: Transcriptional regulator, AraC family, partial [uncultured Rubrobacteraceae bacterium]
AAARHRGVAARGAAPGEVSLCAGSGGGTAETFARRVPDLPEPEFPWRLRLPGDEPRGAGGQPQRRPPRRGPLGKRPPGSPGPVELPGDVRRTSPPRAGGDGGRRPGGGRALLPRPDHPGQGPGVGLSAAARGPRRRRPEARTGHASGLHADAARGTPRGRPPLAAPRPGATGGRVGPGVPGGQPRAERPSGRARQPGEPEPVSPGAGLPGRGRDAPARLPDAGPPGPREEPPAAGMATRARGAGDGLRRPEPPHPPLQAPRRRHAGSLRRTQQERSIRQRPV